MKLTNFSNKQKQIFQFMNSSETILICDGAVRSGKTVCMTVAFILWAMSANNNTNYAICGKTVGSVERNVIMPLMSVDGIKDKLKYHRMERYLEVNINGRVNYFYVFGGKDESSYQLIQGITLAGILFDEVALMPKSFVDQAIARTLTYKNHKLWFNCNPEGQLHWFNQEFIVPIDKGERKGVHLHFLMSDNPIIDESQIEEAKAMFKGVFYQRYILGLWVMAEGLIYDSFCEENVCDDAETEGEYYVSCDFGIQNATVFLLWRRIKNTTKWLCIDEWYYSGRANNKQKTVSELVEGLHALLVRNGGVTPKQVIIDPSASALITEVRRYGFHAISANNDVTDGIQEVGSMIAERRLMFNAKCKNTIAEFSMYVWDEKAAQRGEDKPVKDNDHCMDAVRYFVKTTRVAKRIETKPYQTVFAR